MSVYMILDNKIHDAAAYERYKAAARPLVEAAGGAYLTRDGNIDVIVGDWHPERVVIIKWPSREVMGRFMASNEYQPWKQLRESASTTKTLICVDGDGDEQTV